MAARKLIQDNGFLVISDVFSVEETNSFRREVDNFLKRPNQNQNAGGITIPDFIIHSEFKETKKIIYHPKINAILKDIFNGNNFRFCHHNDIGVNRIVEWHKDKLNGPYASYETIDIWSTTESGEQHEIVKVLIYLEDHANDSDGLKLVPGSHLQREVDPKGFIQLRPKLGDVIIFDQRITHRGMDKQVPSTRILLSFGFGKNNIFTDNFEKGTIQRQNDQNKIPCAFFNDTTSQLNWGCHATTYFTKKLLRDNNFNIVANITLHETLKESNINSFIKKIIQQDIQYLFINGEGSLYEQKDIKGKQMLKIINLLKERTIKIYLINSGFDLYKKESLSAFKDCISKNLYVQIRETVSLENFKKYFSHKAILQPDFLLTVNEYYYNNKESIYRKYNLEEKNYIVIGGNSNYYRPDRDYYDAVDVYIRFINKLKEITNKNIIVYAASEEEIEWLNKIAIQTNCSMISVKTTHWKEALIILGSAYLSISGRYHPTLMSLIKGVPSLMFSANHCKMEGINDMFELPDKVINSHEIHLNYDIIIKFVKKLRDNNEYLKYVNHIVNKYNKLKESSVLSLLS